MAKRNAKVTYRVRPVWHKGSWVVRSPDLDNLLLHAPVLQHVGAYARQSIGQLLGGRAWNLEVVVLPPAIPDAELHDRIEGALARQALAKVAAQEASDATFEAIDVLSRAGMDMTDVGDLLGMTERWQGNRRTRPTAIAAIDDDPWLSFEDEDDDWGVNPWERHYFAGGSSGKETLAALAAEVGGAAELTVLDDAPLPDEDFVWDGIADDIWEKVVEVLALCDHACDTLFDVEVRTATRRALAQLARFSPKYFRRAGSAAGMAAALCWVIGKSNRLFSATGPRIGDLGVVLGTTGPSTRARSLLPAAGFEERGYNHIVLGSAAFLVSQHRARIIEMRDRFAPPDDAERLEF